MNHVLSNNDKNIDRNWYIDSGCSNHMSYNKEVFENLHAPNVFGYVQTGDDTRHSVELVGQISLQDTCGTTNQLIDVFYVPTITKNLNPVGQMMEKGLQVNFNYKGCFIEYLKKGYKVIAKGKKEGRTFTMDIKKDDRTYFAHGNEKKLLKLIYGIRGLVM